jgi:hypothetical protein
MAVLRNRRLENAAFLDRISPHSQNFLFWRRTDPAQAAVGHWRRSAVVARRRLPCGLPSWDFVRPACGVLAALTYHRAYDDVLLAFLLIELARRAFTGDGSRAGQLPWVATGLSLWLPHSIYLTAPAPLYPLVWWVAACTAIWMVKCERGDSNPHGC